MSRTNKISAVFTAEQKATTLTKINDVKALLPFLINLPKGERKKNFNMGSKSVDYVQQCLEAALAFPDELNSSFNVEEFSNDVNLIGNLRGVRIAIASLLESIDDSMDAAGIDAMAASGEVYDTLKLSAKNNASVKAMVDLIAERFKDRKKSETTTSTP